MVGGVGGRLPFYRLVVLCGGGCSIPAELTASRRRGVNSGTAPLTSATCLQFKKSYHALYHKINNKICLNFQLNQTFF